MVIAVVPFLLNFAGSARTFSQLKNRRIPYSPVRSLLAQRLKAPVFQRPAQPKRPISIVYFFDHLVNWFPAELICNFRSNIKVYSGNNKISTTIYQLRNIA